MCVCVCVYIYIYIYIYILLFACYSATVTWAGSRRLLWWLVETKTTVAPPVHNTTTSSAKTTTTSVTTTVRPTAARTLLVTLSSTPRSLIPKRPHYQKPTTQVIPKKFGKRPSFGRILGENLEVSGDGDGAGKEDGLEADAGSGEDKTEFLFQPEWPEVTYFTTDLKQAGTAIVNFNGVNKLFMNVINKSTTNEKLS